MHGCATSWFLHRDWLYQSLKTLSSLTTLLLLTTSNSVIDLDLTHLVTFKGWLCWTRYMMAGDLQCVLITYTLLAAFCPCCIGLKIQLFIGECKQEACNVSCYCPIKMLCIKLLSFQLSYLPLSIFHLPADKVLLGE